MRLFFLSALSSSSSFLLLVLLAPRTLSATPVVPTTNTNNDEMDSTCTIATVQDAIERGTFETEKLQVCLRKDWDGRLGSAVRSSVEVGKRRLDALVNVLNTAKREQAPMLEPAFQWAQSATDLFINVKMAHKIDAPACIDILDSQTTIEETKIGITAECKDKKFVMELELFGEIDPSNSSFAFTSVGRGVFFLRKSVKAKWARLEYDGKRKQRLWHEKQEQYNAELDKLNEFFTPVRRVKSGDEESKSDATTVSTDPASTTTTTSTTKDEFDLKAEQERLKLRQNAERKKERVVLDSETKKVAARKEFDEKLQKIDEEAAIKRNRIVTQLKLDLDQIDESTKQAREKNSVDVFGMLSEMLKAWDKDEL